ncbi:DNA polymerase IV [Hirschia baltica]|uniref:DNA polymerase IV n=1 Tax=Hirschia baltica (strain ATCC 49814 / DSM 5838 / IFAM 1418) TaxID=582402 RepID=C6XJ62_HIRBI|nr:DNA polymerase IV [Hirschia baltica]ACT59157.1 DNA-directed DNA polymerase [Hirschia baltica ATCC 49814]
MSEQYSRKIIHIDMDAFFASVEQRDDPTLRGKPVAVGGGEARGVVAAASYEAREYGVRSAMASVAAKKRCPDLIFVPPRFDVYKSVSNQIRNIFAQYTHLIEPLSLDEAYLDVTDNLKGIESATQIAMEIRAEILKETGLTASAGVSYNKFIAKLASDENKPNGQCVIPPKSGEQFVAGLPIRRFYGVGPVTAKKMERLGILTGADLKKADLSWLRQNFGNSADYYYAAARGKDDRIVQPNRIRKSVGVERTYSKDLFEKEEILTETEKLITLLWERIERANAVGHTIVLKVKFSDFKQITRSHTLEHSITEIEHLDVSAQLLLGHLPRPIKPIRLLGLTLTGLIESGSDTVNNQLSFPF